MKALYKRIILLLVFISFFEMRAFSQTFGNEWINFSSGSAFSDQQYYKIKISSTGLYRIPIDKLESATGVTFKKKDGSGVFDARKLQIFAKGQEQYIYLGNFSDSTFDVTNGYLDFYAEKNDGWFDKRMFIPDSTSMLSPYQSLFTDTAIYFLTWNNRINNKRIINETDQAFGNHSSSLYFMKEQLQLFKDYYAQGEQTLQISVPSPEYTKGEGYTGPPFAAGNAWGGTAYTAFITDANGLPKFTTPNIYAGATDNPVIETALIGLSENNGFFNNHSIGIKINNPDKGSYYVNGYNYNNYDIALVHEPFNVSKLSDTYDNQIEIYTAWPSGGPMPDSDRDGVSYLKLTYPHNFNFTNEGGPQLMVVKDNNEGTTGKSTLTITNFPYANPILYDLTRHVYISISPAAGGNSIQALIPNSATGYNTCLLTYAGVINTISASDIVKVGTNGTFKNYQNASNANADYLIITHKSLLTSAGKYQSYRASKSFTPLVVDVDELYDQFAYGINKHPLSIRNFVRFASQKWTSKPPQYMLLLGKSISTIGTKVNGNGDVSLDLTRPMNPLNLVPTMGQPPSDILLAARCNANNDITPVVAIGRVSARNEQEADDYLQKIKDYESNKPDIWMKHIIHLVGGIDQNQQNQFKIDLLPMALQLEAPPYGGIISWFYKTTTGLQINQTDSIKNLINNGVSILNFFGHSAQKYFDVSLSDPRTYNNIPGRYPLFLAMGCDAGAIHEIVNTEVDRSNSEDYVLLANKGAIAFMGTTLLSEETSLGKYGMEFYDNLANKKYGSPVGICMQQTIARYAYTAAYTSNSSYPLNFLEEVIMAMTLEGDPALKINTHLKPDLTLSDSDISFEPGTVSTDIDSFIVNVNIYNVGKAFDKDTFYVDLTRRYPDGTDTTYRKMQIGLVYNAAIRYKLPVNLFKGPGLNHFSVYVDAPGYGKIDENAADNQVGEMNNQASTDLIITSDLLFPTFPPPYAIIDKSSVTLKATTGSLLAPLKSYTIEMDTTDLFNSPSKTVTDISQVGGIVSWSPALTLKDSVVYYWRTSPTGKNKWKESSFTYINGKRGWSQLLNYQFKGDAYQNSGYSHDTRKLYFNKVKQVISAQTHGGVRVEPSAAEIQYSIDGSLERSGRCTQDGFIISVIDTLTGRSWHNAADPIHNNSYYNNSSGGLYGSLYCDHNTSIGFDFPMSSANNDTAFTSVKKLINAIPKGMYVLVYSYGNMYSRLFPPDVVSSFSRIGATAKLFSNTHDNMGYILFGRKDMGAIKEDTSSKPVNNNPNNYLKIEADIFVTSKLGYVTSTKIGPTKSWKALRWQEHSMEVPAKDSISLSIIGITSAGVETPIITGLTKDSTYVNLTNRINAKAYPYIRLQGYYYDSTFRTPPQIDKWRVFYDPATELALNPAKMYYFYKDTMDEGDVLKLNIAVENISDIPSDSVRIDAWIYDHNRVPRTYYNKHYKPLQANGSSNGTDTTQIRITKNSLGYPGANYIWIEVNPDSSSHQPFKDQQIEQTHTNNELSLPFYVKADKTNPLLDVTFDGAHILDKDIVSPKPEILIRLKDNSKFIALKDTSTFRMWVLPPGQTDMDKNRVSLNPGLSPLRFSPAVLPGNNVAEIDYKPVFAQDGIYTLMVEATDASKNESGKQNYRISFEVINKSTITEVLNYPNPFSTNTRFVFVLTGSEIPSQMKIQIMTISGKIVREITQSEIGPIRIGRNITEYAWDGKDEYGDQLANGVYIYRVLTNIKGNAVEKRNTEADKYFVKGYGKMYLLR